MWNLERFGDPGSSVLEDSSRISIRLERRGRRQVANLRQKTHVNPQLSCRVAFSSSAVIGSQPCSQVAPKGPERITTSILDGAFGLGRSRRSLQHTWPGIGRRGAGAHPSEVVIRRERKARLSSCVIARRRVTPFRQPKGRPGRESPAAPEGRSPLPLGSSLINTKRRETRRRGQLGRPRAK